MGFKTTGSGINPAAMTTAAALEAKAAALLLEDGTVEDWQDLCLLTVARAQYVERLLVSDLPFRSLDGLVDEPRGNVIPFRRRRRGTGS